VRRGLGLGYLFRPVRTVPITHIAAKGTIACERKVVCGDYREGESIAMQMGPLASCDDCRRIAISAGEWGR
jgi:hypothetical protein